VEGLLEPTTLGYERKHALQIFINVARWNTHRSEPLICEPLIACFVMDRSMAAIVTFAIDFDRETRRQTGEIEDVRSGWMLAAELEAARPLAKLFPKKDLRQGHLLP
jgi:hypothetical protein